MLTLQELKEIYKKEIEKETQRSLFLEKLHKEMEKYKDKAKITKRETDKISEALATDYPIYKTCEYEFIHLYITKDGEKYNISEFRDADDKNQIERLLKGIRRDMSFDYIAKHKAELENLEVIYKQYTKALDILENIKSIIPNNDYPYHLRDTETHHKRHSYLLTKHLILLDEYKRG